MKRIIILLVAACFGSSSVASGELLRPTEAERMHLVVNGKERVYFRAEPGAPVGLSVTGPGELKFIVRAISTGHDVQTIPYSVTVAEGKRRLKNLDMKTTPSPLRWEEQGDVACNSRRFSLHIPPGRHELQVIFASPTAEAAGIRYLFRSTQKRGPQAPLQPLQPGEPVTILVKEHPLAYYVTSLPAPVGLEIIGPTRLRVVSRLVYPPGERGRQHYKVAWSRDGGAPSERTLTTVKTSMASSPGHPDWILGRSRTFYVEVPKGRHTLSFRPAGRDEPAIALRFTIPQESVVE